MSTDPLEEVTTVTESATMFNVEVSTLRHAIRKGTLYAQRSGNVHLIRVVDVVAYFQRQPNQWPERLKKWEKPEQ